MGSVGNALKNWFLFHDNAPAHRPGLVKDFVAEDNTTTLEHPPYRPELALADFYLFPKMRSAGEGQCFWDTTDVNKNATEELKSFSQKDCFQHLYSAGRYVVLTPGDCFEGNAA
jgi:hypothetical protein